VATSAIPSTARRRRHDPKETEREIIEAAERLLGERPFREVTVPEVMRQTGLKRPAFYVHFRDRSELMLRIVGRVGDEVFASANRWFEASAPEADLRLALEGVAKLYASRGPLLRALADAAAYDPTVEAAYVGLLRALIDATTARIRAEQRAGRTPRELDAERTAQALTLLGERYLSDALGRHPQDDPMRVAGVLLHIWHATLYAGVQPAR
jgi:AcrR family transcriptional regulator